MPVKDKNIVVFGSTGYVGTRLVSSLIEKDYKVRVTYRDITKLEEKTWHGHKNVEAVKCDILNYDDVLHTLTNQDEVFYLVHSMDNSSATETYETLDIKAARNVVTALNNTTVNHLIYLGGLGDSDDNLSQHLRSRNMVGEELQKAKLDVTILRAAVIIGGGSAGYEILRYLVERLPIMVTPSWTHKTVSQPIAIENVIEYLIGCLEVDEVRNRVLDIGGPDIITYNKMMQIHAEEAGLPKRLVIPVPILSPKLSYRWIGLMTPTNINIARGLVDGLRNDAVCLNDDITKLIPQNLIPARDAIKSALEEKQYTLVKDVYGYQDGKIPIAWSQPGDPSYAGGPLFHDRRAVVVNAKKEDIWHHISSIGGKNGWYYMNFLWTIRGIIDRIVGGPGMRRGRKHPTVVEVGDVIDCWRVMKVENNKELILRAEMRIFGIGTLRFSIHQPTGLAEDQYIVEQHATYVPHGLTGNLYWKLVAPLHNLVFKGMLVKLVKRADATNLIGPKPIFASKALGSDNAFTTVIPIVG